MDLRTRMDLKMMIPRYQKILCVILLLSCVTAALAQERKRVFYLNSYHEGYGSSDDVMRGIRDVLGRTEVELKIFLLDSKRRSDKAEIEQTAREAVAAIEAYQPDDIIASDDNAVQYVIAPRFKHGSVPIVFCGVNWSADQYDLPRQHVTGMLEVVPVRETIETIRRFYPRLKRLFVLSEESLAEASNRRALAPVYRALGLKVTYANVRDFDEWKQQFNAAQEQADLLYLPTNGAIKGWDEAAARAFVQANIRKPVITTDDFMMSYAVFGLTKVAREQGEWAAHATLEILAGRKPADIAITRNQQSQAWFNPALAARINFKPDARLLKQCRIIKPD